MPQAALERMWPACSLQPKREISGLGHECDMCDLSRAGAADNQKKQGMLQHREFRDVLLAEADLRLDPQLDCKRGAFK